MTHRRISMLATALGAGLFLTACATNQTYLSPDTGRALKEGYAKQIVNPNAAPGAPMVTPEVAAAAIQRYIDGEVYEPDSEDVSFRVEE